MKKLTLLFAALLGMTSWVSANAVLTKYANTDHTISFQIDNPTPPIIDGYDIHIEASDGTPLGYYRVLGPAQNTDCPRGFLLVGDMSNVTVGIDHSSGCDFLVWYTGVTPGLACDTTYKFYLEDLLFFSLSNTVVAKTQVCQ